MRRLELHEPDDLTWAAGERRLRVLGPLARSDRTTVGAVDAAARELGIERAQCYRLLRRLRAELTVRYCHSNCGWWRQGNQARLAR